MIVGQNRLNIEKKSELYLTYGTVNEFQPTKDGRFWNTDRFQIYFGLANIF